jgi:hypothetical protein
MPLNTTGNRIVFAAVLLISLFWSLTKNIFRLENNNSNNNNVESEAMATTSPFIPSED